MKSRRFLILAAIFIFILFKGESALGESALKWEDFSGGIDTVIELESTGDKAMDLDNARKAIRVLDARLAAFKVKRIVRLEGRKIIVQTPKLSEQVFDRLFRPGRLEFCLIDDSFDEADLRKALSGQAPPGIKLVSQVGRKGELPLAVMRDNLMEEAYIKDATVEFDERHDKYNVTILFTEEGATRFAEITEKNVGFRLAVILDETVYTAPRIVERISGGRVLITGKFSTDEALALTVTLKAGALPARVRLKAYRMLTRDIWLGESG